jgi:solute carrier family 25 carnitine/acylcarnitine transporter 20/29
MGTSNEGETRAASTVPDKRLHGAIAGSGSTLTEALVGLASGVAYGAVSPLVGHPFDTVKTRMQAEARYQTMGTFQVVGSIFRSEGFVGFYRGFVPPLIGSMAFRGILFSAYSGTYAACEHVPMLHQEIPFTGGLRSSVLLGALAASVARASIESPFEFLKVRSMVGKSAMKASHDRGGKGTATLSENLARNLRSFAKAPVSSVQHLYHGFGATLLRTMGLLGSFFIMIDYAVRYIPDVIETPLVGPFFKGGICATTAWVFAFPFESAKSVIQADTTGKYKNMRGSTWKVMRQLYTQRGLSQGLYRGFFPGASRSFFANGTSMIVFAWFQDKIRK